MVSDLRGAITLDIVAEGSHHDHADGLGLPLDKRPILEDLMAI